MADYGVFVAFYFECPECGPLGMATSVKDGLPMTRDHRIQQHAGERSPRVRVEILHEPDVSEER